MDPTRCAIHNVSKTIQHNVSKIVQQRRDSAQQQHANGGLFTERSDDDYYQDTISIWFWTELSRNVFKLGTRLSINARALNWRWHSMKSCDRAHAADAAAADDGINDDDSVAGVAGPAQVQ
jgi:hypothetical protein